jgi:charged multivesicular body protein 3
MVEVVLMLYCGIAMVKVTGSLQKSTEIMKLSNAVIKLPQISQTMREMSMEMTKVCECELIERKSNKHCSQAGIMEEMMNDTLDMEEDEELEEEADAEVDKVLFELTNGKLGEAGSAGTELPVSSFVSISTLWCLIVIGSPHKTNWTKRRQRERWRSIASS